MKPTTVFGSKNKIIQVPSLERTQLTTFQANSPSSKIVQEFSLSKIEGPQVVLFGSDRQKEIGVKLDELLAEVTKGSSPILFELFTQLKKGVDSANLPELEIQIRKSQESKWWHSILDSIKLSSATKRLQNASGKIENLLTSKAKSLSDLTRTMESQIQTEVAKLISDSSKLAKLALEYHKNIKEFSVYVEAGELILERGKQELEKRKSNIQNDFDADEAKNFEQKVDLFESRLLVLKTILAAAPAELESIRLSQGASLSTLGETANAATQEFSDIKSALIKLSVIHQIKSVQAINDSRRSLRNSISVYGDQSLKEVAVKATQDIGSNRLKDAQNLLEQAERLKETSDKVLQEKENNKRKFEEAKKSLLKVREMLK